MNGKQKSGKAIHQETTKTYQSREGGAQTRIGAVGDDGNEFGQY
jgi:hypothetical protein